MCEKIGDILMSLSLLSKHRKELMAIAMLWLASYHSNFPYTNKFVGFIASTCAYGGVDLFIFLSSFGLYYAYKKYTDYFSYIRKRLLRILPYNIPFVIFFMFYENRTVYETVFDSLGLSLFVRQDLAYWFTSFIVLMYIITPLYLRIFNKKQTTTTFITIFLIFIICIIKNDNTFTYVFFRTAVFALGFYFAYLNDNKNICSKTCWLFVLLMIAGWIMMYFAYHLFGNKCYHVYPLLLITPGLLLLFGWILDKFTLLNKPLSFIGNYTYQFYLIHEKFINFLYSIYGVLYISGIGFDWWINIVGIVFSLFLSVIYKTIIDSILKFMRSDEC